MDTADQMIRSMYYALTTLSTVGYGDFYPVSVAEKILGSIIQIFGVTFFSILMNGFIEVVVSIKEDNFRNHEEALQKWLFTPSHIVLRSLAERTRGEKDSRCEFSHAKDYCTCWYQGPGVLA